MPDRFTIIKSDGSTYALNRTFRVERYDLGSRDRSGVSRRDRQTTVKRRGDGLNTPQPYVLTGVLWTDDRTANGYNTLRQEAEDIRDAVRSARELRRDNDAGTFRLTDLIGGAKPAFTPQGRWEIECTIELWPVIEAEEFVAGGLLSLEGTAVEHHSTASSDPFPMPVPSGAQANDVLVATIFLRNHTNPGADSGDSLASGWTNIPGATHLGENGNRVYSAWYQLDGSEGSTIDLLDGTGENKDWIAVTWLLRHAHSSPVDGADAATWAFGDASVEVPSVTGSDSGVLIGGAVIRDDGLTMTIDDAMTEAHNDAFGNMQYVVGHETLEADGATGTRTHTANTTSVGGFGFSIAIQPS